MSDFIHMVDLASERLGGTVIVANDEFFASKENLLKVSKPIFADGKYTSRGKWMDGWETRRRRAPGHDWCIVRLGLPGVIHRVTVDTSFFLGNYPERCSLEACHLGTPPYRDERRRLKTTSTRWHGLLPERALKGDSQNSFPVTNSLRFTHVRLKIYPDGGVARLRIHGEVVPDLERIGRAEVDLAGVVNGGMAIASSDQFFSEPLNLLMPGRGKNMGDGWETRRRRGPGHDWVIVKLGVPGTITAIEVDTSHFKGNFPESCSVEACCAAGRTTESFPQPAAWKQALPRTKLLANRRHIFRQQLQDVGVTTHVRLNIFPDGGVSRLRILGRPGERNARPSNIARLNALLDAEAKRALLDCCASSPWAQRVLAERPFSTAEELLQTADSAWANLDCEDWLAAFRHHPPIGGKKASTKRSGAARRWSANEQSVALRGKRETMKALAAANRAYKAKFGYVFLICAAGKTSEEILRALQRRLSNDAEAELRIATEEQRKITHLRLEKLLES